MTSCSPPSFHSLFKDSSPPSLPVPIFYTRSLLTDHSDSLFPPPLRWPPPTFFLMTSTTSLLCCHTEKPSPLPPTLTSSLPPHAASLAPSNTPFTAAISKY